MSSFKFVFALLFLVACGEAPIFDHRTNPKPIEPAAAEASSTLNALEAKADSTEVTSSTEPSSALDCEFEFSKIDWCGRLVFDEALTFSGLSKTFRARLELWDKGSSQAADSNSLPLVSHATPSGCCQPPPARVQREALGRYLLDEIIFFKPSIWEFFIEVESSSNVVDSALYRINLK